MRTTRIPSASAPPGGKGAERVTGERILVHFSPGLTTREVLCAGVVVRAGDGSVTWRCAIDEARIEHAFDGPGRALYLTARHLCESAAQAWAGGSIAQWTPPFERASITEPIGFSAQSTDSMIEHLLTQSSSLHGLLANYELPSARGSSGIVADVRRALKSRRDAEHLARRFTRELNLGNSSIPLRVDFLGQRLACYFVRITASDRAADLASERALGRMMELQALRGFVSRKRRSLGLLDDERPAEFELLMVGDQQHPVQSRVMNKIIALADKKEVRARPMADAESAAHHVLQRERAA